MTWREGRTRGLSAVVRLEARMLMKSAVVPSIDWRRRRATLARRRTASSSRLVGTRPRPVGGRL